MLTLNLQIFAQVYNTLTNNVSPGHSLSAENKTYYDMILLDEAAPMLVHDQFGQRRPIPAKEGDTINFRKYSSLGKALTPLVEGVTPDGQALNVSAVTATVSQYGGYVILSDLLDLMAIDNNIVEATKLIGRQAGLTLDTITRNIINAGTNVIYASKWNGATETPCVASPQMDKTSVLKVETIERAVAKLKALNAPTIDGSHYVGIVHPYTVYQLRRDPEWIDSHKYASPEELFNGEIGRIAGVRFVETSEALIKRSADLASDSHTLTLNGAISAGAATTFSFDGGTVAGSALVGRKLKVGTNIVTVTANTTSAVTFASTTLAATADNTTIYPADLTDDDSSVFCSLIVGKDAYGVTEVEGGGMQTIIKQKGSSGVGDALDQRSSVGWKAIKTAKILDDTRMVRIESTSARFPTTAAN